jgi:subtilisin family serine protease
LPSRSRNSFALALASLSLAFGAAARAAEPECGPFPIEGGAVQPARCGEPGIEPAASPQGQFAQIEVETPRVRELARPGESLLALPKGPGGLPLDYELGPGARIASSFFSPVLCATVARVVGPEGATPEQLVTRVPATAALVPHSVYLPAGEARALERGGDDPYRDLQYALDEIEVEAMWSVSDGGGVTVALLDSAPDAAHRELSGMRVVPLDASAQPPDATLHGTLLAGVIGARADNGFGIRGVAPGADLAAIPVCGRQRAGAPETCGLYEILRGLDAAWEQKARVVNLSLVGPSNPLLERAMSRLERLGVALVAAAGNENTEQARYPAAYPSVIGVGAVDRRGERYARSNRGLSAKLLAPGVEIVSTAPHASFAFGSGTSLAAAHVSGVMALLVGSGLTPEQARALLVPEGARGPSRIRKLCALLEQGGRSCKAR